MTPDLNVEDEYLPPPPSQPPRLLTDDQILTLARQGHLPLPLSDHLFSLYAELDAASTDFFSLPLETKSSLYSPEGNNELGFVSIPGEKDYVTFRARTAHANDYLEQLVAKVWQETFTLLYRVLGDLSYGMDISHSVWDNVVDGTCPIPAQLEVATPTFLRIFRYAADKGTAEPHTDMGLLTLCVCQGKGLQVLTKDQDGQELWTEYNEPTLLVGQTLRVLSGGLLKAGVHRVVQNSSGRGSIVYALRPSTIHEVDLSSFSLRSRQTQETVHLSELWRSIWTKSYNVNAPREVREKQKQQLKQNASQRVGYEGENEKDITNTRAAFVA